MIYLRLATVMDITGGCRLYLKMNPKQFKVLLMNTNLMAFGYTNPRKVEAMGDIADMIIDGTMCQTCGCLVDGETPDYPRDCEDCKGQGEGR